MYKSRHSAAQQQTGKAQVKTERHKAYKSNDFCASCDGYDIGGTVWVPVCGDPSCSHTDNSDAITHCDSILPGEQKQLEFLAEI